MITKSSMIFNPVPVNCLQLHGGQIRLNFERSDVMFGLSVLEFRFYNTMYFLNFILIEVCFSMS